MNAAAAPMIDRAWAEFRHETIVESFGIFWIAAEVAILFCMGVAARILEQRPLPKRPALTPRERRRAWTWAFAVCALAAFVYARHAFIAPLPVAFGSIADAGVDVVQLARNAYLSRAHIHVALWCALVVAWVALEIAIVAQGIRVYRRLEAVIAETRHAA
jgi:hypothetical protein